MDIVERINNKLVAIGWSWSDLAKEMDITPERINNWKKRGVPAGQIKHIAAALSMQRLELEGDGSTQLRELTEEQAEVLVMWELLLSSQREQVKQWAAYTREVLSEKVDPRVVRASKGKNHFGEGAERKNEQSK